MYVMHVAKDFQTHLDWLFILERIVVRNLMCVQSAEEGVLVHRNLKNIWEFIQAKNHMSVNYVQKLFPGVKI